jgi:hypothetical protein
VDLGGGHGAGALRLEMEKGPTKEKNKRHLRSVWRSKQEVREQPPIL